MTLPPTLLADVVVAVMTAQTIALTLLRPHRAVDTFSAILPGLCLALALRAALAGAPFLHVALWLALSGPVHLFDMARRGLYDRAPRGHTTPLERSAATSRSE